MRKANSNKIALRKNDLVQVIAGKEKGEKGKIISVDRIKNRVTVEGLNLLTKHVKPNQTNQQGGIMKFEGPIHYSNVLLYCKKCESGVRIRKKINDDASKNRVCVKCGSILDE